ncbi:MAG: hypothetical protein U5K56_20285 [Halioglobus sp.]|nr:hypothetical protein [Halioglobus sp.]
MHRSAEQGSERADDSWATHRTRRDGSEAASPVTVVTDADYRCAWRPCEALEADEAGSPPG